MSVYIDTSRNRLGRMMMCHMLADTLEELHAMADRIGMKREWFQPESTPHYDVSKTRRALAIQHGAIEADRHKVVELIRKYRAAEKRTDTMMTDHEQHLAALARILCGEVTPMSSGPRRAQHTSALAYAIDNLKASPAWLPIDTAPKDAGNVLLFLPIHGGQVWLGHWGGSDEAKGWRSDHGGAWLENKPSHWMPLPAAPALEAAAKGPTL